MPSRQHPVVVHWFAIATRKVYLTTQPAPFPRSPNHRVNLLGVGAAITLALGACTSTAPSSPAGTPSATSSPSTSSPSTSSSSPGAPTGYQLHMDFFSRESKLATVIDPQVFQASQGAPAATGPQGIAHTAGLAPAAGDGPAETPLRGAHGSALKITLGSWKKAAGTVSFSCVDNQERATSRLTGLLSGASYSVFVVHLDVQGAGRFTPWGDAEGTTNNFTADSSGTASVTNSVPCCLTNRAAAVVIWHSDGMAHGPKPGTLG